MGALNAWSRYFGYSKSSLARQVNRARAAAANQAPATGDPYFGSVNSLLHFDGADGSSTITESSPRGPTWAVAGAARIDTDNSKFGGASLKRNGGAGAQGITSSGHGANQEFATGDFTIEGWYNGLTTPEAGCLLYLESSTANRAMYLYNNVVSYGVNSASSIALAFAASQWNHWAIVRSGTTLATFLNGNRVATATYSGAVGGGAGMAMGYYLAGNNLPFTGYIDEFRMTKGVCRYDPASATYTVPSAAFPNA